MEKTMPEPNTGCLLWTGATDRRGYGKIGLGGHYGRTEQTHRVVWACMHGVIPPGLCVLHRCDTPACVNAAHLFLGTKKDNTQDMMAKGRHIPGIGRKRGSRNSLRASSGIQFVP